MAPKLDLFEVNGDLVYYDHRRKRQLMTGRKFRSWIENFVYVVGGYDRKTGAAQKGSLGLSDAMDVLEAPDFRLGVREIQMEEGVRLPVIRGNGDLELLPEGYDHETGVYTVPGALEYDLDWDVTQGKEWFEQWFGSMPYADERSKAVMVAGLLVLYVRHLPGGNALRPGFLWEANMAGSGKSLCGKACCSIVLGYAPVGKRKGREEMDKELEAYVRSKSPVIFLDNLYGSIRSAALDQLVTSKIITFRTMREQSMEVLHNDAPVFLTGNELEKNEDAWRRYLQCQLFEPGDPNKREVANLLDDDIMQADEWRRSALSALWSFVKMWDAKGRPKGDVTLGSFEMFSYLMGGIVTACGYENPMERPAENDGLSPEQADFRSMVKGLHAVMVEEGVTKRLFGFEDMAKVARAHDLFGDIIGDQEHGKQEFIKREKLKKEDYHLAADEGHLTQQELQPWQKLMKSKIGQEPTFDGVKVRFGDYVTEKRKGKFTLEVI